MQVRVEELSDDEFVNTAIAAKVVKRAPSTLRGWRVSRRFLPYVKGAAGVQYRVGDLRSAIQAMRVEPVRP